MIPMSGSFPGEGHGDPLQYSYLENSMDRGAWWATWSMGSRRGGHDCATNFNGQRVKNPPAMKRTQWVQSLGLEGPLGVEMSTNSSILA